MMNLILIVQTQSLFGIGNFTTLMRCSVNKNRRQSVKDIVFLLLILGIIKGRKDCLVTIFIRKIWLS